jgi:transposase
VYFRLLLIGYLERLDSARDDWRVANSLSLRKFIGYSLEKTPDHSTISRTRRLFRLSAHPAVFTWVLNMLAD